jgi:hypothetical protein
MSTSRVFIHSGKPLYSASHSQESPIYYLCRGVDVKESHSLLIEDKRHIKQFSVSYKGTGISQEVHVDRVEKNLTRNCVGYT